MASLGQVLAIATGFALAYYLVRLAMLKWVLYVGVRTLNIYLVHVFVIAILVAPLTFLPQLDYLLPGRGLVLIAILTTLVVLLLILITRYLTRVSWLFVYPFGRKKRVDAVTGAARGSAKATPEGGP